MEEGKEDVYTAESLKVIRQQEELLRYEHFGSAEALALGNAVAELALRYDRGVGIRITREADSLVLFQYMMDDKDPRNEIFMEGKRRASLATGHCSLWPYVEHELSGLWQELFDQMPDTLPCGGAFPIREGSRYVATLAVSGLHEGKDHELVVLGLCKALGKTAPAFLWRMV